MRLTTYACACASNMHVTRVMWQAVRLAVNRMETPEFTQNEHTKSTLTSRSRHDAAWTSVIAAELTLTAQQAPPGATAACLSVWSHQCSSLGVSIPERGAASALLKLLLRCQPVRSTPVDRHSPSRCSGAAAMAAADSLLTPLSSCTAHGRSSWQQVERRRHASSAHGGQHGHVAGLQPSGEGSAMARSRSRALPSAANLMKVRIRPFGTKEIATARGVASLLAVLTLT